MERISRCSKYDPAAIIHTHKEKITIMIRSFLASLTLIFSLCMAHAQNRAIHDDYEWSQSPKLHTVPDESKSYPAVHVLHNRFLELRLGTSAQTFFTEHKIIHINSDAGIEQFNKVYIPVFGDNKLVSLEVRAIDPSGKVTNLKKENLKELKNVEGVGNFKIFAVEGLAVGGEVEYVYTTQSSPQSYGRYMVQSEIPVMEANIEIVFPDRFMFAAKSYNGMPQPKSGVFDSNRRNIELHMTNVPALLEEEYAAHDASRMRLDFKLESNGNNSNFITWPSIGENFVKNNFEAGAGAKVRKFLKALNLESLSEEQQIREVEQYIKSNFTYRNSSGDAFEDTKTVIEKKVGSERGILKVFMGCWEELNLRPQLVLCSNRIKGKIDPQFACPSDITDVLFYFPTIDKYLDPTVPYFRLGAAPDYLAGTDAVFVKFYFEDNHVHYTAYDVHKVKPLTYLKNNMGVKALVRFTDKLVQPQVNQETFWQGYRAASYRGYYYYADAAGKEEFLKQVTLSGIDGVNILKRELEGDEVKNSFDPEIYFRVKTDYTASTLVEQAGEDYLFSVGKLIGKQSELYQEKMRQMNIEFNSISNYNHELTIEIPEGYSCTGLEAINIKNELTNGKEVVMKFESAYELNGNKLVIRINEFYKELSLPKDQYEPFRKVVNSAADFNKVVLVLHPVSRP
jgi:hypothetical protein